MASLERGKIDIPFRVTVALVLCATCLFVIGVRLWYLQIVNGEYFRKLSENNRIRIIYLPPPRGLILDRNNEVLVKNRPAFNIEFVSGDSPNPLQTIHTLAKLLDKNPDEMMAEVNNQRKRRRFEPKIVLKDVSRDVVARVVAHRYVLPGIIVSVSPTRDYLWGDLAAHTIGYIREISSRQLDLPTFSGYRQGDVVGQFGIELKQEQYLRGVRGVQEVIVNATGTKIGEAKPEEELPGHNVRLTLDLAVQKAADEALKDKTGAIVAMDPNTGEVLAMTSSPRFDPNVFTREISPNVWQELIMGAKRPLNNRATQGAYPPGSVFKIFMAAAGLAEGVITRTEKVNCPGWYQLGRRKFHCHKHTGHGMVDLFSAMTQSCDVFFYTVGQRLGIDRIHEYATKFGFGRPTGLEAVEEAAGLIPSTAWKRKTFKRAEDKKWYPGETPSVAIGQGAVTVTPLQVVRGVSALINGGHVLKPYLVKEVTSSDGTFRLDDTKPQVLSEVGIDKGILNTVREALIGVVNDPHGTGHKAQLDKGFNITVGGKSGTAQVVSLELTEAGTSRGDHAWFVGFAPAENPQIVVSALVENGGHGGAAAAPMVKQVMETFFRERGLGPTPTPTPTATPVPIKGALAKPKATPRKSAVATPTPPETESSNDDEDRD